jgi:pimeloyl-ACP methyl ester carboxylesterase
VATFDGADGTRLAYHQAGEGRPLICLPGGPMQASAYLGDLGGLSAHRWLVLLDLRGTGASALPADPTSYRCDRQVDDVEALRMHLGLGRSTCWDTPPVRRLPCCTPPGTPTASAVWR